MELSNTKVTKKRPTRGRVVSLSKDMKTAKVEIPRIVVDALYGKHLHRHTVVFADASHAQNVEVGKHVEVLPCRPVSKLKSWKVMSVVG